ncbi:MAG: type II toxin-antitoxin system VapC family toxin [Desulfobacterales bacterium]|nr:type II toxin-antitoxin system VapC family toxin [Desulfobacterales bacterium]
MKALDTNVLVRFLVCDDEAQAQKAYNLFKAAERRKESLFVPMPVTLEIIWVLDSVYGVGRREILETFKTLLAMPVLEFQSQHALRRFISMAEKSGADLADLLIACAAEDAGCSRVLTFDKKASGCELFELMK